jgi:integrating conjugative element protein (TIGR03758 family)
MVIGDALSAFETAAGMSPAKISLLIRTVLLTLTFVWAAWCIYGEIHHFSHGGIEIECAIKKVLRILFIVTIMVSLVFI